MKKPAVILMVVVVAVAAGLLYSIDVSSRKAAQRATEQTEAAARRDHKIWNMDREWRFVTQYVEMRLKAPATAKFCGAEQVAVAGAENGSKRLSGWVDSQNSFGALIRSAISAVYSRDPQTQEWTLQDVRVDGE